MIKCWRITLFVLIFGFDPLNDLIQITLIKILRIFNHRLINDGKNLYAIYLNLHKNFCIQMLMIKNIAMIMRRN
jgi:hypothetical protein